MGIHKRRGLVRSALALTLLIVPVAIAPPAAAQEAVLELDPARTRIDFTLPGFPHSVHGTLTLKRGTFRVDSATGRADGLMIVDAASGQSGNRARDSEMNESVLETHRYPEITFAPPTDRGPGRTAGRIPGEDPWGLLATWN